MPYHHPILGITAELNPDTAKAYNNESTLRRLSDADTYTLNKPAQEIVAMATVDRGPKLEVNLPVSRATAYKLQAHATDIFPFKVDVHPRPAIELLLEALFLGLITPVQDTIKDYSISVASHEILMSDTEWRPTESFIIHIIDNAQPPQQVTFMNHTRPEHYHHKLQPQHVLKLKAFATLIYSRYPAAPESIALDWMILNHNKVGAPNV